MSEEELARVRKKQCANFTQRFGMPQLAKEHSNELTPATETASMPFSLMSVYR
jgi:hypothetical protein